MKTILNALGVLGGKIFDHKGREDHKEIRSHFNINHVQRLDSE